MRSDTTTHAAGNKTLRGEPWPLLAWLPILLCALIPGSASPASAASSEVGLPPLQVFHKSDYGAARQNWAITQDQRGIIYIGNVDGVVLSFDGVRWRSTPLPDIPTIRSLASGPEGRVYVGGVGDFGFLEPDAQGRLRYISLLERLAPEQRDFTDVWDIFAGPDGIYFFTFKGLYRVTDDTVRRWAPTTRFHLAFQVEGRIFVREVGKGLQELIDDQLQLLPGGERFADERIYAMLPWSHAENASDQAVLIGTREIGWYVLDRARLTPWRNEADAFLEDDLLYQAILLDDHRLALATLRGGVILLAPDGRLIRRITLDDGLPDNGVFRVFQDDQDGLWLALSTGIARLDVGNPVSRFDRSTGLSGQALDIARYNGRIFTATTDGLYGMITGGDGAARFAAIDAIRGQTWRLLALKDGLLVSTMDGVYLWRDDEVSLLRPSAQTSFALLQSRRDPDRVWISLHTGLAAIYRDGKGGWLDEGRLPGLDDEIRTLYETDDGTLWAGTWYKGALRLRPDPDADADAGIWQQMSPPERFGTVDEGDDYSLTYLESIDGQLRFGTRRGLMRFDPERGGLVPDQEFAPLFPDGPVQAFPFYQDARGRVWLHSVDTRSNQQQTIVAQPTRNSYVRDTFTAAPLKGTVVRSFYGEKDGVIWLGAEDGLFRLDAPSSTGPRPEYDVLIRAITERESGKTLYGGDGPLPSLQLEYADNTLRFEYATPTFTRMDRNRYRVMLEGLDHDWSSWSDETFRDYTHIREGHYRFKVQARDVYGTLSRTASIDFRIFPPWYRSLWAYVAYILLTGLAVIALFRWRLGALRRHAYLLEQQVAERTQELSAANHALAEQSLTDPLTGLRNRRYLTQSLPADIAMAGRHYRDRQHSNADLLFLMIDIDHFKTVNDRYGHSAGDAVLQQFSGILHDQLRESDTVARWGGEEFLLVARCTDVEFAAQLAERLRSAVSSHDFELEGHTQPLRLTCSIGFAQYPLFRDKPEHVGWSKVVDLADLCLYAAKRSGRDIWVGLLSGDTKPSTEHLDPMTGHIPELIACGSLVAQTSHPDGADGLIWQ